MIIIIKRRVRRARKKKNVINTRGGLEEIGFFTLKPFFSLFSEMRFLLDVQDQQEK
jgi:hypothetical protein